MKICFVMTLSILLGISPAFPVSASDYNTSSLEKMLRGTSGKLLASIAAPDSPIVAKPLPDVSLEYQSDSFGTSISSELKAPQKPGWYQIALKQNGAYKVLEGLRLITLTPFEAKKNGRIGNYFLGLWPFEQQKAISPAYKSPAGFIEVTLKNINLQISEHFKLSDFVDQDQANVWPKYVALDTRLVDKLELIISELNQEGIGVKHLAIMCGFRSPNSNATFGDPSGRGKLSRHMFGDAADIYVDNNKTGWTQDINHDGRVTLEDVKIIARAAARVEAKYPNLVGGIGIYPGNGAHGPFIHIDVRGQAARWNG